MELYDFIGRLQILKHS